MQIFEKFPSKIVLSNILSAMSRLPVLDILLKECHDGFNELTNWNPLASSRCLETLALEVVNRDQIHVTGVSLVFKTQSSYGNKEAKFWGIPF